MNPSLALALNAPIRTARLELEPITAAHADAMFVPMLDERIYRYISAGPVRHIDALREKWTRAESRLSPDGSQALLNWAVRRLSDGAYLGKYDVEIDSALVAINVGYSFFPDAWGQGHASEALRAVIERCAGYGVRIFHATVDTGNAASVRVLIKCGFVRTGIFPDEKDTDAYLLRLPTPSDGPVDERAGDHSA